VALGIGGLVGPFFGLLVGLVLEECEGEVEVLGSPGHAELSCEEVLGAGGEVVEGGLVLGGFGGECVDGAVAADDDECVGGVDGGVEVGFDGGGADFVEVWEVSAGVEVVLEFSGVVGRFALA